MAIATQATIIKTFITWAVILGVLVYGGWQAFLYMTSAQQPHITVTVGDATINARVAHTPETLQQGLSGSQPLGKTDGMLFVFGSSDTWGIWMKEMTYPLDIIWLDEAKRVVYMVKSAEPSSYPYTTFKPSKPAKYVLEVAAGTIESKNLKINNKASFDLSSLEGV